MLSNIEFGKRQKLVYFFIPSWCPGLSCRHSRVLAPGPRYGGKRGVAMQEREVSARYVRDFSRHLTALSGLSRELARVLAGSYVLSLGTCLAVNPVHECLTPLTCRCP